MTQFHKQLVSMNWPIKLPVVLIFVVPDDIIWEKFKRQTVSYKHNPPILSNERYRIEQFVITVNPQKLIDNFSKQMESRIVLNKINAFFSPMINEVVDANICEDEELYDDDDDCKDNDDDSDRDNKP